MKVHDAIDDVVNSLLMRGFVNSLLFVY